VTIKEILNKEYTELCQKVGHLTNNKEKIERELEQIKERIKVLDSSSATLAELDKLLKRAEEEKQARAQQVQAEIARAAAAAEASNAEAE
jgi:acetolactate synthase small subunit